jgi:hypothetical protein
MIFISNPLDTFYLKEYNGRRRFNLLHTTRLWNKYHIQKIGKPNDLKVFEEQVTQKGLPG